MTVASETDLQLSPTALAASGPRGYGLSVAPTQPVLLCYVLIRMQGFLH